MNYFKLLILPKLTASTKIEWHFAFKRGNLWIILYMLLLVWAADVAAYFSGKTWGQRKLAPRVSPGKSWEGAWGGLSSSIMLAIAAAASSL